MKWKYLLNRTTKVAGKPALCMLIFLACSITVATAKEPLLESEYSYRRYTTADGLPSILNQRIYQDKRGYIWVAGTSGLARFDGFRFKTFLTGTFANLYHIEEFDATNDGREQKQKIIRVFSNRYSYNIFPDADTLQRTMRFKDLFLTTFSSMTMPAGYGIFYAKDNDEEQYFCAIRDTGIVKLITHENLNKLEDADKAWYDEDKKLLYIPLYDGISVVNDSGQVAFHAGIHAKCFTKCKDELWAVTINGLYRQTSDGNFEKAAECLIDRFAYVMAHSSSDGQLLFSDYTSLYRYDGNHIEKVFEANVIKDFIIDREGSVWVSTYQGVYNLFKLYFKNWSFTGSTDNVRSIVYDTHGKRMIVGSLNGKLIEIIGNRQREITYPPNPFTADMTFSPNGAEVNGTIYLPGPAAFLQLKGVQSHWVTFPDLHFVLQFITPLPDGNLLTGGTNLLIKTTTEGNVLNKWTNVALRQRIYSKPCVDKDGRIWIGGADGINIIDGDSVTAILGDSLVYCRVMNTDSDGNLWFASENRLYKAESEKNFRRVYLFNSQVTNIHCTQSGILAVTTLDKIHLFDKNRESYVVYDNQNGFTGMETIRAGMAEDVSGNLWLPAVECLTMFNPALLTKESSKPHLHLLTFLTSTNNIHWKQPDENNLRLDYRHKNIRFEYIGLSYSSAQNIRYQYRLLGFQNEWSEPTKQREVTFNNLPPGNYTFEIYADAGTDESRSETKTFSFTINPAFWQTTWFLILAIIFLSSLSFLSSLIILRRKNRNLLEKLRTEKELNELKISSIRLKAIPHFNANVLAAIEYYIANRTKEEAMRILGIYSDFTLKTLSEVDKAARPLSEELAYVKMYLDLEKIRFMEKFDFHIHVEDEVDKSVQLPNMILHTYCENAVKHGLMPRKSGGLLTIYVSQRGQTVCVHVEDNGVGRAYAAQNPHLHSTKQGLSILNRQIEIYNRFNQEKIHQQVEDLVSAGKPSGTRFIIEVPLNFTYFS